MEKIMKKVIIFSMVGMMQVGLGGSVIEAASMHREPVPMEEHEGGQGHGKHERHERHERERIEKERHEQEMKRHPHEDEREWHERQQRENEQHEENLKRIAHDILEVILDK